jgi:hypothetical protein
MSQAQEVKEARRATSDWCFRAQLFGGLGNGLVIRLPSLAPSITVFQNGGAPFAVADTDQATPVEDARRLGEYELVGPLGPETPVYVARF